MSKVLNRNIDMSILHFEEFQKARVKFVPAIAIAEAATSYKASEHRGHACRWTDAAS